VPPENPERPDDGSANGDDLLWLQREANEKLVLAGIRAHEELDDALGAQRRAEEDTSERRVREEELLATAEFRERMIGIIGHDLRNPLSTIVMACGLLIAHGDLTEADARLADRIVNSARRMTRMIGQLVEFTRARLGGGFELNLAPSNLGDVCRNIAEELRISSSAEIRETIEGNLGGTWDADRLAEVVSNIAANAVDHATPGTPVLIHAHDDGGAVVAEITNQGACIPPDLLPVIFKAFRGEVKPNTGHLGLGLYIASEIVRSHSGTLDVRSSDGTTTFRLRLPRVSTPP
jgi:signal transduction histidine kinase